MPIVVCRFAKGTTIPKCLASDSITRNDDCMSAYAICGYTMGISSICPLEIGAYFPLRSTGSNQNRWKMKSVSWAGKNAFAIKVSVPVLTENNVVLNQTACMTTYRVSTAFVEGALSVAGLTGNVIPVEEFTFFANTNTALLPWGATASSNITLLTDYIGADLSDNTAGTSANPSYPGQFVSQHLDLDYDIGQLHTMANSLLIKIEPHNIGCARECFLTECQVTFEVY